MKLGGWRALLPTTVEYDLCLTPLIPTMGGPLVAVLVRVALWRLNFGTTVTGDETPDFGDD